MIFNSASFDKLRTIDDFKRANEEWQLRKQAAANEARLAEAKILQAERNPTGQSMPAVLQINQAMKDAIARGDKDEVNRIAFLANHGLTNIDYYGSLGGGNFPPQNLPGNTPPYNPAISSPNTPQVPTGNTPPYNPNTGNSRNNPVIMGDGPSSIANQQANNAKLLKQKQTEGKLETEYDVKGRQSLPKIQRSLESAQTNEAFIQPKIADLITRGKNLWTGTGFTGSISGAIPGTPAYDLKADLSTLLANAAFDKLQDIRNNSPTGGALGSVSEYEVQLLQTAAQNLMNSQSEAQFVQNLENFQKQRIRAFANVQKAYEQDYQRFGGQQDPYLPSPKETANDVSGKELAPYLENVWPDDMPETPTNSRNQYDRATVEFNLKKQGFTPEEIREYMNVRGGR